MPSALKKIVLDANGSAKNLLPRLHEISLKWGEGSATIAGLNMRSCLGHDHGDIRIRQLILVNLAVGRQRHLRQGAKLFGAEFAFGVALR